MAMWYKKVITLKNLSRRIHKTDFCLQTSKTVNTELKPVVKSSELTPQAKVVLTNDFIQTIKFDKKKSLSFEEIPGPAGLKVLSKFWGLFPTMSTETVTTIIRYFLQRDSNKESNKLLFKRIFEQYGPIVKLHGIFGNDIVLLSKPEHANVALNCKKSFYIRSCLDSIEKYRKEWRRYAKTGPFLKLDDDWELVKTLVQDSDFSESKESINNEQFCEDFIKNLVILRNDQGEVQTALKTELYKWSLECLSDVMLNEYFGFQRQNPICLTSEPGRLLDGITGASDAIKKLETGFRLWRLVETPTFHGLIKYCNNIDSVLSKYVRNGIKSLRDRKDGKHLSVNISLLEHLLLRSDLVEEDIMTILLDTYIIVSNATSHTVALLLYHLAKNPRSQIKLHEEIVTKGEIVTTQNLDKKNYLNACLKECLRLNPPLPIISRQLEDDVTVNHYRIQKGTYIFYSSQFNSSREEYFEDPSRFKPERWLSGDLGEYGREYQAFATNTFGFGPQAKVVKSLMYTHVARLITKVISKFKVEYNYRDGKSDIDFLSTNSKPIHLRFINRIK